jgi:predicted acetyltransferase
MFLRELTPTDEQEIKNMLLEYKKYDALINRFEGIIDFSNINNYQEFLKQLELNRHIEDINPQYFSQTTYALVDANNHIYGIINIRHCLTPSLLKQGGNIGYSIRPLERHKGYATLMLNLALEKAKELAVNKGSTYEGKVLLTCRKENIASAKTMLKCGATYAGEEQNSLNKEIYQKYWLNT